MKTIIVGNIVTPVEIERFNLINEMLDKNLCVLFRNEGEINRHWRLNAGNINFNCKILPDRPLHLKGKDVFTLHINYTVFSELKKACPDVVISCGWDSLASYMAYLYCKMYNKKFILWAGSTINEPSWRRTVSKPLVNFLVRNSDAYIAYGTRAKEYLMHLGAKKERIFIGWNTVDNHYFDSNSRMTDDEIEKIKSELGIKAGLVIFYAGQLIERKGVYDLLDAFSRIKKEVPDVALLIAGTGMEESNLKKRCLQEGIVDAIFAGFIDYDQLPRYFGISDLFILPSHEEVWGLVINEAMACGLPVITTKKVGASVDLVKNGINGFVIKEKSSSELYDAMRKIVTDDELRFKMAASSKQIISNFDIEHTAKGIIDAVSYVCREK